LTSGQGELPGMAVNDENIPDYETVIVAYSNLFVYALMSFLRCR
jgi:hypothetical protein